MTGITSGTDQKHQLDYLRPISEGGPSAWAFPLRLASALLFAAALGLFGWLLSRPHPNVCDGSFGILIIFLFLPLVLALGASLVFFVFTSVVGLAATIAAGRTNRFSGLFLPSHALLPAFSTTIAICFRGNLTFPQQESQLWIFANVLCLMAQLVRTVEMLPYHRRLLRDQALK